MTLLEQYSDLKRQAKEIDSQLKELEPQVLDKALEVDGNKLITDYGTFTVLQKKTWVYTVELQTQEEQFKEMLKIRKREQEINGKAKLESVKSQLRFQGK